MILESRRWAEKLLTGIRSLIFFVKGKQWVPRAARKIRVAPLSPGSQECFSEILTWGRERRQRGSL